VALRAGPLLATFNRASILTSADVHIAQRLGRLTREDDERVLLAVALAVRAVRSGSVCVTLDDLAALAVPETEDGSASLGTALFGTAEPAATELPWPDQRDWRAAIERSPLVAVGGGADRDDAPARWVDGRLYLDRYWRDEQLVRAEVDGRLTGGVLPVDPDLLAATVRRCFPDDGDVRQRVAAATAALSRLTVVTGGPGTGKTTTVARLLAVVHTVTGAATGSLRVALAAPTGKAAARLQEAVRAQSATFDADDRRRVGLPDATTVHRLLGWKPGSSTRFRHDHRHRLPHDLVVVDETSMVSLPLMARLLEALRPDARLVLVGDPDQLASVEAGAVLGDLVARPPVADDLPAALRAALPAELVAAGLDGPAQQSIDDRTALRNGVVRLTTAHRFGGQIDRLAAAIRDGRAEAVLDVLRAGDPAVTLVETEGEQPTAEQLAGVRADAVDAGAALIAAARAGDTAAALAALESHRVLLAHRRGPFGVQRWAFQVESWVAQAWAAQAWVAQAWAAQASGPGPSSGTGVDEGDGIGRWYAGRPLLVTANDRDTGLYNGDTGVLVAREGGLIAAFGDPQAPILVRPHRLPAVETVHATTVHRGQGSQFAVVSVLLPPPASPLLTRELLYTAVTRARQRVRVVGSEAAVRAAVERPVRRGSGLRHPVGPDPAWLGSDR
jgi:exodeoxyribonuclease V alpha subunit